MKTSITKKVASATIVIWLLVLFVSCTQNTTSKTNETKIDSTIYTDLTEKTNVVNNGTSNELSDSKKHIERFQLADKLIVYNQRKATDYSSKDAKAVAVVSALNDSLANDSLVKMKLIATKDIIQKIKENEKCFELSYKIVNSLQIKNLNDVSDDINFDRLIYVYSGDYSGVIFFVHGNDYSAAPLKIVNNDKKNIMLIEKLYDSLF